MCTFLGGAQDKLTERESALNTIGRLGGGSGTSATTKNPVKSLLSTPETRRWENFFHSTLIACQCFFLYFYYSTNFFHQPFFLVDTHTHFRAPPSIATAPLSTFEAKVKAWTEYKRWKKGNFATVFIIKSY